LAPGCAGKRPAWQPHRPPGRPLVVAPLLTSNKKRAPGCPFLSLVRHSPLLLPALGILVADEALGGISLEFGGVVGSRHILGERLVRIGALDHHPVDEVIAALEEEAGAERDPA